MGKLHQSFWPLVTLLTSLLIVGAGLDDGSVVW